ncbi:hypothetical protein Tco_0839061 [Tanacetum coccineum]|uniref:Reverse transcriptase domain-containing protein n=1 Tax=Tanacetum coccineum TaxID=301880 RepID=A0ABQ5AUL8_9ASTR
MVESVVHLFIGLKWEKLKSSVRLIKRQLKRTRPRSSNGCKPPGSTESYTYMMRYTMEFHVGDKVMLKVSPWKGVVRFGKRGKLNPRRSMDGLHFDDKLQFVEEPVEIVDREVKRLKRSRIPLVKVRWNSKRGPEFTWEREDQFKKKYPHLFATTAPSSSDAS